MNERHKRELVTYLLFDYEGIEEHLEKMAARGWFLETPGNQIWTYRKGEPAEVKYAVTYVPKASQFDPEPIPEQKTLEEFCGEAGWQKVGYWLQAQIFMNYDAHAVPLETEEEVRLEVIRHAMKKSFVPAHVVLTLLVLFNLWRASNSFFDDPLAYLSGYGSLLSMLVQPIAAVLVAANLIGYYVWLHRSAKSVEAGGSCVNPKFVRMVNRWQLPVIGVYFIAMIAGLGAEGNGAAARYMVFYMIGFFCLVALLNATKNFMKKRGASRGKNMAVFIIVDIIGAFAMVAVVMWLVFSGETSGMEGADPYAPEVHETFLVKQTSGELETPPISYDMNQIKVSGLYDWCLKSRLSQKYYKTMFMHYEPDSEAKAALWGADQVYYCDWGNGRWILTKDNYIVEIWIELWDDETLEDAEKSRILTQLGIS